MALSRIEISKKNLIHNIGLFRRLVDKKTKISVAIKSNAYGHGQKEVVEILEPYADYFQINSIEELILLRKISSKPVFLLGYASQEDLKTAIKLKSILAVFSFEQLKYINKIAERVGVRQEIHIPIDAHLGREGFLVKGELPKLLRAIKKCKNISLTGMYAHFANIEDTSDFSHAQKQIDEYELALKIGRKEGFNKLETHLSATSGIIVYEKNTGRNSIVRLGIGAYGMWPSEGLRARFKKAGFNLKPVLSWKTKIAQLKILPKGHSIGYGLTYRTNKPTKIAIVPQGYGDGFPRGLSNKGEVLIKGMRCPILGRVSMNMFAVNVSRVKQVKVEDEVIIIGSMNKEEITAEELADKLKTINYEITARINPLLPRIVV